MSYKTVDFRRCPCGKRGFEHERAADKALGRGQAKRLRKADANGTRRGVHMESRTYWCDEGQMFHTTSESRRSFNQRETIFA